jgi:hypothetical protein
MEQTQLNMMEEKKLSFQDISSAALIDELYERAIVSQNWELANALRKQGAKTGLEKMVQILETGVEKDDADIIKSVVDSAVQPQMLEAVNKYLGTEVEPRDTLRKRKLALVLSLKDHLQIKCPSVEESVEDGYDAYNECPEYISVFNWEEDLSDPSDLIKLTLCERALTLFARDKDELEGIKGLTYILGSMHREHAAKTCPNCELLGKEMDKGLEDYPLTTRTKIRQDRRR